MEEQRALEADALREDSKVMTDRTGMDWIGLSERAKEFVRALEGADVLGGMKPARRKHSLHFPVNNRSQKAEDRMPSSPLEEALHELS